MLGGMFHGVKSYRHGTVRWMVCHLNLSNGHWRAKFLSMHNQPYTFGNLVRGGSLSVDVDVIQRPSDRNGRKGPVSISRLAAGVLVRPAFLSARIAAVIRGMALAAPSVVSRFHTRNYLWDPHIDRSVV